MTEYVSRELVHERLMSNQLAGGYHTLPDGDKERYLDEIMALQFSEAAKLLVNILSTALNKRILNIPLRSRLRYTACRLPMMLLGENR